MGGTNVRCQLTVPDPDLEIRGAPVIQTLRQGETRVPWASPLDPPLVKILGFLSVVS